MRPTRWEADKEKVEQLLTRWTEASVEKFIDTPTEEQSSQIEASSWTLTLRTETEPFTLRFTNPDTNGLRLACGTPNVPICNVSGDLISNKLTDPLHYRSPTVLEINPAQIEKITRQTGDVEQTIQKSENGSFNIASSEKILKTDALTDIMWELNNLKAKCYTAYNPQSLTPYGLDSPHTRLIVTLNETDTLGRVLLLGNETENGRFAMVQGRPVVFELPAETIHILLQDLIQPAATP
jgi:hypothetical protein